MSTLIRTTDELPFWFKIENYQKVKELSEEELAKELGFRSLILDGINLPRQAARFLDIEDYTLVANFPKFQPDMTWEQWASLFRSTQVMAEYETAPDFDYKKEVEILSSWKVSNVMSDDIQAYRAQMDRLGEESKLGQLNNIFVRPTTLYDVQRILRHSEAEGQLRSDVDTPFIRLDDLKKDDIAKGLVTLTINMAAKNQILKDGFAEVLPVLREHSGIEEPSKPVGDSNITKIAQFKVIAYIDLWLWGKLNDKRVTDPAAADALFEKEGFDEDKIKDTVRPLAEAALEDQFINTLRKKGEKQQEKTS